MDERKEEDDEEAWLQLRPVEPLPSQCCGSGCSPCVFDLYHRNLARWEAARASKDRSLLRGKESQCYQTGLMSRYVESWRAGDTAFWRGPFGGFSYKPNQYGELLMLAAGTGLAPMVPILHSITDNADDETFVTLVSCFKTFEGIYLKTFLQEQARFWNVRTFFVLSQGPWDASEHGGSRRKIQVITEDPLSAPWCCPQRAVGIRQALRGELQSLVSAPEIRDLHPQNLSQGFPITLHSS
ncbi:NADH-cytochrome b5 reductase-like isoform X1 [Pteropus vampyrus]|uniref:NADH-cytochrome b5 reductase-like isoform X1 n=1 Tax=Pteropus vampyrus TaxID=132908 RepID=A0A6P6D0A5_PTEVA|nr:NADH-cytochrome b5 reductase-like isoform X1 [Pteropus vampyrus]